MPQETVFGRREPSRFTQPAAPRPASDLPSLKDLGCMAEEDAAELRAYKQHYRRRRFVSRGGWRWVGGLCFAASGVLSFTEFNGARSLLGLAGLACLIVGFLRPAKSLPEDPAAGA